MGKKRHWQSRQLNERKKAISAEKNDFSCGCKVKLLLPNKADWQDRETYLALIYIKSRGKELAAPAAEPWPIGKYCANNLLDMYLYLQYCKIVVQV